MISHSLTYLNRVYQSLDERKEVFTQVSGFSKAFDQVCHGKHLVRLQYAGIGCSLRFFSVIPGLSKTVRAKWNKMIDMLKQFVEFPEVRPWSTPGCTIQK